MYLSGFVFLLMATGLEAVSFLVVSNDAINYFDASSNHKNVSHLATSISRSTGVDFHFRRNEIYFFDVNGLIKRAQLHPDSSTSNKPVTILEVKRSNGLAVDWINDNLYWTDEARHTVETSSLDGLYRRVLFNYSYGVKEPKGIALDPTQGLMFWIDGKHVESAGLDGTLKKTIVSTRLIHPNVITLDLKRKTVYILDQFSILSYNYEGYSKKTVFSHQTLLKKASGMTFYGERLFWSSNKTYIYYMNPISTNRTVEKLIQMTENVRDIRAVGSSIQKDVSLESCEREGCSHRCLLGKYLAPKCYCPYGYTLHSDAKTCQEEGYLLLSLTGRVKRYDLDGNLEQVLHRTAPVATNVAYHYSKQLVFWSTDFDAHIYRAPLSQLNNKTVLVHTKMCGGLAVDWIHDVVYWTDSGLRTVEVARLDGSMRRIIFSEKMDKPKDIALDPFAGYMFWTVLGIQPKIERAGLDGSNRMVIIHQQEAIQSPNSIAIDMDEKRIYWVDSQLRTIRSSSYDGSDIKRFQTSRNSSLEFFGISLFKSHMYLTDWTNRSLSRRGKNPDSDQLETLFYRKEKIILPYSVKVVHSSLQREQHNPCNSKKCAGLCLGTADPQQVKCFDSGLMKLLKTTVNHNSAEFQVSGDRQIPKMKISITCIKRLGCASDSRCSRYSHSFTVNNHTKFETPDLLQASVYNVTFESTLLNETFEITTLSNSIPEIPKITSIESEARSTTIRWTFADSCFPEFERFHYELKQVGPDFKLNREGNTTDTHLAVDNLEKDTEYIINIYTTDRTRFTEERFKTVTDEVPECMADEFLCNNVEDCEDGKDESRDVCAAIKEILIYTKSSTSVSFRVTVSQLTRKNLLGFVVSSALDNPQPNMTEPRPKLAEPQLVMAEPCAFWNKSYCFTVPSLLTNQNYKFKIRVKLNNGTTGESRELTNITKEEAPGLVEHLVQTGATDTSITLKWNVPTQSNGKIQWYILYVHYVETFNDSEGFKNLLPQHVQDSGYSLEYIFQVEKLKAASTYTVKVLAMNSHATGGFARIEAYTSAPPQHVEEPIVHVQSTGKSPVWKPSSESDQNLREISELIERYLLLVLTENVVINEDWPDVDPEVINMLKKRFSRYHIWVHNNFRKGDDSIDRSIPLVDFYAGYKYRLVWVVVSKYKEVYSVDFIESEEIDLSTTLNGTQQI